MFRGAIGADLDQIMKVYERARTQMAAGGNPVQWGAGYPSRALLERDITSNRLFVYMVNGHLEAVFAFLLGEEPTYATIHGAWLNQAPYGTLHRLASAGTRKGIGDEVIAWCLEHCDSLRIDTHEQNKTMQHILEKNGFTRCGIIRVEDGSPRIAYQKIKESRLYPSE